VLGEELHRIKEAILSGRETVVNTLAQLIFKQLATLPFVALSHILDGLVLAATAISSFYKFSAPRPVYSTRKLSTLELKQ
jgi:ABC-type transporter Mla maintaining outer membrane lipid asymmetry permease subunit MlaE